MNMFFNENKKSKRLVIRGFSENYRAMLSAVLSADFFICRDNADLILCDSEYEENDPDLPTVVLGRSEKRLNNKLFMKRPVSLKVLRRELLSLAEPEPEIMAEKIDPLILDSETLTVSLGGRSVRLTGLEFALFSYLYQKRGEAVSREEIRDALWQGTEDSNICDVYICYLRKKLEKMLPEGCIVSLRGRGYMLRNRDV